MSSSQDEYSIKHILRTALYDARGGKTIGFSHGDDCVATESTSYLCDHIYCFPGEFHKQLLARNSRFSGETIVIGSGFYGLDVTFQHMKDRRLPQRYDELRRSGVRLVGVFASSYGKNLFLTRENTMRFYQAALSLLKQHADIRLVIRPKNKGCELNEPEFHHLLEQAGSRAILEDTIWTYDLLPALDLTICISISTVGLESLMAGIPVIYYDEGELPSHPYGRYDSGLLARTPQELAERVQNILSKNQYVDPKVLDHIRLFHGYRFDGKVTERFRKVVRDAMQTPSSQARSLVAL